MTQSHNNELMVSKSDKDKSITINFGDVATVEQFNHIVENLQQNLMRGIEVMQTGLEENSNQIVGVGNKVSKVETLVKTKEITSQQLRSLESLVDKKAKEYVDRSKGVQLNIDVMLSYDGDDLKALQKLINTQYGKTKQKIWVELNKDCLGRKGTDPKNRIKATQVDEAFDFVRMWGGFSI